MRRLPAILFIILLASLSGGPAAGQTPGPASPQAGASVGLSGVAPLPLTGDRLAEFETYITGMLAQTEVPGARSPSR